MKRQLLTTLALLSLNAGLYAADGRFCNDYARTAVKQQVSNIAQSCAEKGPKWSPSYIGHKAWCLGASKANAIKESDARRNALSSCGADTGKINWQTLPDIPRVWDRLFSQMLTAAKKDDATAVNIMHKSGVNIKHNQGAKNGTILYHAVDLQAEKTAVYLLSQNANPRATTHNGGSALSKMIEDKRVNYRMLAALLKKGFDPNYGGKANGDAAFPLLLAAQKNDYTAVQMMLKAGGNANLKRDATPLLYAVKNRNMSMITLLIKSGANPNLSGRKSSCLPLNEAQKGGSRGVIEYLKTKGARTAPNCR
ncbi:MAG: ankyrin repeat domain-containing protein [Leucothrix sp.]